MTALTRKLLTAFSLLGLAASAAATWVHYQLLANPDYTSFCDINATVSFSVAQAVAAAEAVERGLRRREADGQDTQRMGPVITLMIGRLEDWLRVLTERADAALRHRKPAGSR